jgi:hypothetical protein
VSYSFTLRVCDLTLQAMGVGVRGLHLGSGSAMKLCYTRIRYLWLEAAQALSTVLPHGTRTCPNTLSAEFRNFSDHPLSPSFSRPRGAPYVADR